MRVFDFDETLYQRDSTAEFSLYCLRKYPRIISTLPRTAAVALAMGTHALNKTKFKEALFRYIPKIPDIPHEVELFWSTRNIEGACADIARPGDLVISASPEFLLRDVLAKRGLKLIGTKVDPCTGRLLGPNCSSEEKIRRYREMYGDEPIDEFYSDSHNDDPMAAIAREAYMVKKGTLIPWPEKRR